MIIIVEGIDRVGKTTLCKELQARTGIKVYKTLGYDYSKATNYNETQKMLEFVNLCETLNGNIIFDRFHLSDFVYGITKRGYDMEEAFANYIMLDGKLKEAGALLIRMVPTDIKKSSEEHGEDLTLQNELYTQLFNISACKKIEADYYGIKNCVELTNRVIKCWQSK